MAVSEAIQAKLDGIQGQLTDLGSDIAALRDSADVVRGQLEAQVSSLTAQIDAMNAEDATEDAAYEDQITSLTAARDALQQTLDTQENDVLAGLDNISNSISSLDMDVEGTSGEAPVGGDDGGEAAPVEESPVEEAPSEEPAPADDAPADGIIFDQPTVAAE